MDKWLEDYIDHEIMVIDTVDRLTAHNKRVKILLATLNKHILRLQKLNKKPTSI